MHEAIPHTPSQRELSATQRRYQQPFELRPRNAQNADVLECYGKKDQRVCALEKRHFMHDEQSRTIGEWLDLCGINLNEYGVCWPRDELNGVSDLRCRPKQTTGQYVAWNILKDEIVAHLPSFEELIPRLDIESCRDAWFLKKPIKLKEDCFKDFKAKLLEETGSKIRLLNVPVAQTMVSRTSQRQHSVMVRERLKHLYGVGYGHSMNTHDATTNVTPRGTATEIHYDSDLHISTARDESGANCELRSAHETMVVVARFREPPTCDMLL